MAVRSVWRCGGIQRPHSVLRYLEFWIVCGPIASTLDLDLLVVLFGHSWGWRSLHFTHPRRTTPVGLPLQYSGPRRVPMGRKNLYGYLTGPPKGRDMDGRCTRIGYEECEERTGKKKEQKPVLYSGRDLFGGVTEKRCRQAGENNAYKPLERKAYICALLAGHLSCFQFSHLFVYGLLCSGLQQEVSTKLNGGRLKTTHEREAPKGYFRTPRFSWGVSWTKR